MTLYHCAHISTNAFPKPLPHYAFIENASGLKLWQLPCTPVADGVILSPVAPDIAGHCEECGEPFGWHKGETQ